MEDTSSPGARQYLFFLVSRESVVAIVRQCDSAPGRMGLSNRRRGSRKGWGRESFLRGIDANVAEKAEKKRKERDEGHKEVRKVNRYSNTDPAPSLDQVKKGVIDNGGVGARRRKEEKNGDWGGQRETSGRVKAEVTDG